VHKVYDKARTSYQRLLDIVERLEKELGKPIIEGDLTIYCGIIRRLGIKESLRGHGKLLANLV